jgi:hypothetical protein
MIFDVILAIIAFILTGVAIVLPVINLFPAGLSADISSIVSSMYGWSWIFPIGTIITLIGVLVAVVAAEFAFYAAIYVLKLIRN